MSRNLKVFYEADRNVIEGSASDTAGACRAVVDITGLLRISGMKVMRSRIVHGTFAIFIPEPRGYILDKDNNIVGLTSYEVCNN